MKIGIKLQSWGDIITNSSSETFCVIKAKEKETIEMIQNYLNSFLPYKVEYDTPSEPFAFDQEDYTIYFNIEYGVDSHKLGVTMYSLLKELLTKHFPNNNTFTIEDGENYN